MSKPAVVIDSGSQVTDIGFAGEDEPRFSFRTLVGRDSAGNVFFGDEAFDKSSALTLSYPVKHGLIVQLDEMKPFWGYCFEKLGVNPSEHPVLVCEPSLNPKATREGTFKVMMEHFKVPKYFTAQQATTAVYQSGRTTGVVLDIGGEVTMTVPIYGGYALPHAVLRLDIGEKDITDYGIKLMSSRGYDFSNGNGRKLMEEIQRDHCYVALDFHQAMNLAAQNESTVAKTIALPNGGSGTIGSERFRMPEAYLQPAFLDMEQTGVHECLYNSIMKCDVDIRKELYSNIILTGNGTLYPGLQERLRAEVAGMAPQSMSINIVAPSDRAHSVWEGGSILGNVLTDEMWVTMPEYTQSGASIVHRKCF